MKTKAPLWTPAFIGITLTNLLLFFGFQMLQPTIPLYAQSIGANDTIIGWVTGIFTISALLVRPMVGTALDKLGRKWVLISGLILIVLITFGYRLIPILIPFLILRFIHGFGWGAATTAGSTTASDWIPKERFGEGIGFFSLSSSFAMAIAPAVGLYFIDKSSFSTLFLFSAIFTIAALLLSFAIPYRKVSVQNTPPKGLSIYEPSSLRPSIVVFFISATYGAVLGFLSLYAAEQGITNIGSFFTVYAVSLILFRPIFGKLLDRFGFSPVIYPAIFILIAALVVLSFASSLPIFLLSALLYGIGFGALHSSLQTMAVLNAPSERIGAANATFLTGFDGGIGFGSVVAGIASTALGYSGMFRVFGISLVIALILFFWSGRKKSTSAT